LKRIADVELPVETLTVTLPVTPEFNVSGFGLGVQRASVGSVLQPVVKVPDEPSSGVSTSV
jgi:hypothetical protein